MTTPRRRSSKTTRVLLDTNVWSTLGRTGTGRAFYDVIERRHCEVVVAPSVLLEISQSGDTAKSRKDFEAILAGHRRHLRSQAQLEAISVIGEIRRAGHASWLKPTPDLSEWKALERYWSTDIWRLARKDWAAHVRSNGTISSAERAIRESIRQVDNNALVEVRQRVGQWLLRDAPANSPIWIKAAWPEEPGLEVWQFGAFEEFLETMSEVVQPTGRNNYQRTMGRWYGAYIDPRVVLEDGSGVARFWFYEIDPTAAPHLWIAGNAVRYQAEGKVTGSSFGDSKHVSYLSECDLFLTGDRRLVATCDSLARDAPFEIGRAVRLHATGPEIVDEIEEVLLAAGGGQST